MFLFLGCTSLGLADSTFQEFLHAQRDKQVQLNAYLKTHQAEIETMKQVNLQRASRYRSIVEQLEQQSKLRLQKSTASNSSLIKDNVSNPEAILFLSLGMPPETVNELMDEATQFQIPVVLRGLVNHSFSDTVHAFFALNKENHELSNEGKKGISINPLLFRRYQIQQVPALVIIKEPLSCRGSSCVEEDESHFDLLYGTQSIETSLILIARQGNAAASAERILTRGKRRL